MHPKMIDRLKKRRLARRAGDRLTTRTWWAFVPDDARYPCVSYCSVDLWKDPEATVQQLEETLVDPWCCLAGTFVYNQQRLRREGPPVEITFTRSKLDNSCPV